MTVHAFPVPERSELTAALNRPLLSVADLLEAPLADITEPGPLVAQAPLVDLALRIAAIGQALAGPGAVTIDNASEALRQLIGQLPHPTKQA